MAELGSNHGQIVTRYEEETIPVEAGIIEVLPAWRFLLEMPDPDLLLPIRPSTADGSFQICKKSDDLGHWQKKPAGGELAEIVVTVEGRGLLVLGVDNHRERSDLPLCPPSHARGRSVKAWRQDRGHERGPRQQVNRAA